MTASYKNERLLPTTSASELVSWYQTVVTKNTDIIRRSRNKCRDRFPSTNFDVGVQCQLLLIKNPVWVEGRVRRRAWRHPLTLMNPTALSGTSGVLVMIEVFLSRCIRFAKVSGIYQSIMNATGLNSGGDVQILLPNHTLEVFRKDVPSHRIYPSIERIQLHDIRQQAHHQNLVPGMVAGLQSESKELPSLLLWNDRGQELFDVILDSQDYYPASTETKLLHDSVQKIAYSISSGDRLIELGAGNMRKTALILRTLEAQRKHVEYFALDVTRSALRTSIRELILLFPPRSKISVQGLLGTYEDCASWLKCSDSVTKTTMLWLGNSIANFHPADASNLVKSFLNNAGSRSPNMVIAVDGCQSQEQILRSYENNNSRDFVLNGLAHANQLLGSVVFLSTDWGFEGHWNADTWMHESFYVAQKNLTLEISGETFDFKKNESVRAIMSGKWPSIKVAAICQDAGVQIIDSWANQEDSYRIYLLGKK